MRMTQKFFGIAAALVALAVGAHAQTAVFIGAGSSALFLEAGQAAGTSTSATPVGLGATCVWSQKSSLTVTDSKTETGNAWIAWQPGSSGCTGGFTASTRIYAYVSLDSTLGDRLYFNGGTLGYSINPETTTTPGYLIFSSGEQMSVPSAIWGALSGKALTAAGTDIRPEDAKFATLRAATSCGSAVDSSQYLGLGYTLGTSTINSYYSSSFFNVVNFALPTSGFTVIPVGATPMIFAVNPTNTTNGFGTLTFGGSSPANITHTALAKYLAGSYGYTGDISGSASGANATVLIREPLSGTYNTVEYTTVNTTELELSQDVGSNNLTTPRDENNCNGTAYNTNPLHLASADNANGYRNRVIGTGQAVSEVLAVEDSLGYAFWSTANWANATTSNARYLTVDGYDPLYDRSAGSSACPNGSGTPAYSTIANTLPTGGTGGNGYLPCVTFSDLNNGDYAAWSALRVVTASSGTNYTYANKLAQTLQGFVSATTLPDFVPFASLTVWRSHFVPPGVTYSDGTSITPNNGDVDGTSCGTEAGGDVGGVILNPPSCTTNERQ